MKDHSNRGADSAECSSLRCQTWTTQGSPRTGAAFHATTPTTRTTPRITKTGPRVCTHLHCTVTPPQMCCPLELHNARTPLNVSYTMLSSLDRSLPNSAMQAAEEQTERSSVSRPPPAQPSVASATARWLPISGQTHRTAFTTQTSPPTLPLTSTSKQWDPLPDLIVLPRACTPRRSTPPGDRLPGERLI